MIDYTVIKIEGKGSCVFSNKALKPGDYIGDYITSDKNDIGRWIKSNLYETILGRYCNHSETPNTAISFDGMIYSIIANKPIEIGDEITVNYVSVADVLNMDSNVFLNFNTIKPPLINYGI